MSLCRYDTDKPCENHGTSSRTCLDCILNKIRAEISDLKGTFPNEYYLAIIDKYRKEQVDERANLSSETV